MQDSIETELLAARLLPFARNETAWADAYITAWSRLVPGAAPREVAAAARLAWAAYGWAHPAAVAYLEHELGPLCA